MMYIPGLANQHNKQPKTHITYMLTKAQTDYEKLPEQAIVKN